MAKLSTYALLMQYGLWKLEFGHTGWEGLSWRQGKMATASTPWMFCPQYQFHCYMHHRREPIHSKCADSVACFILLFGQWCPSLASLTGVTICQSAFPSNTGLNTLHELKRCSNLAPLNLIGWRLCNQIKIKDTLCSLHEFSCDSWMM